MTEAAWELSGVKPNMTATKTPGTRLSMQEDAYLCHDSTCTDSILLLSGWLQHEQRKQRPPPMAAISDAEGTRGDPHHYRVVSDIKTAAKYESTCFSCPPSLPREWFWTVARRFHTRTAKSKQKELLPSACGSPYRPQSTQHSTQWPPHTRATHARLKVAIGYEKTVSRLHDERTKVEEQ